MYGPILHRKEGRRLVCLVAMDKSHRTSTSYARYLMSIELGKRLAKTAHVDHIDGDKLNDTLENLQVISLAENNKKAALERGVERTYAALRCPGCGRRFVRERRQTHLAKGGIYTACSRSCSGKFQHRIRKDPKDPKVISALDENIQTIGPYSSVEAAPGS